MSEVYLPGPGEAPDPEGPLTPEEKTTAERQDAYMDGRRRSNTKRRKAREPTMTVEAPSYAGGFDHELPSLGGAMFTHPDDR